jgi:integrase/recombinase XerC
MGGGHGGWSARTDGDRVDRRQQRRYGRVSSLSVRSIQSLISKLARRAHITRIAVSAHTLRHTFALGYLKQNPGKLVELGTLLGHESLDTTAIYTLPSEEDLAADVERSNYNVDA